MIEGVGIDVVNIDRFKESLERTPGLSEKLFTESERTKSVQSLAARFAAKEALAKAFAELEEQASSTSTPEPVNNITKIEARKQITQQNVNSEAA